jgi:DNA-directed RNA polymerase
MVCSFDATCSGLQVFSALGRDEVGAASVNLLPADVPQDIYANVAKEVIKRVEADVVKVAIPGSTKDDKRRLKADAKLARELLKAGLIDRTMCKKPVMTKVYDSTPWGQQRMLEELLDDMEEDGKDLKLEDVTTTVRYLAPIIFDAIYDSVIGASEIMNWFKECAGLASDVNGAIEWQTPVKFKVRQKYMTTSQDSFRTMIDGEIKVKFLKQLRKMHKGDNKAAISANAIHSYDSAHLVLTVDTMTHDMEEIGETPSWSVVHDQFGSHAQDGERLALTLREQFVEMYEMHDPLMDFKESVEAALQIELPDPPAKGGLDIRQVLESSFFFH